jgi:hypothetical protein
LRTATVPRNEIDDWHSLALVSPQGVATIAVLVLTAAAIVLGKRKRDYALLLVLAACAVGPFVAHRHVPLAMLAAAIIGAEHAAGVRARLAAPDEGSTTRITWPVALLFRGLTLALVAGTALHLSRIRIVDPDQTIPSGAVAVLKSAGVTGNLALPFSWGEYVIWHLGPKVKVSVDGRRETVYSDGVYAENMRFLYGSDGWDDLFRRATTDLVLVDKNFGCNHLMESKCDWEAVYEDNLCRIFARSGSEAGAAIRGARVSKDLPHMFP